MNEVAKNNNVEWDCPATWKQSAINTFWCLVGCSFGDIMTIYYFQINNIPWSIIPMLIKKLLITPSFAKSILRANDLNSSFIQNGIIKEIISILAVFPFATFAM